MHNLAGTPQAEHVLLPPPPSAADPWDRLALPLIHLPRLTIGGPDLASDRATGELLAGLPPDSRELLERLAHFGQALPVRLLGRAVERLGPLERAGLAQVESTPAGQVVLLPLEVRFALARRGFRSQHALAPTLLSHLETLPGAALLRGQAAWGLAQEEDTPAGRSALYRAVLRGWRDALDRLPAGDRALFDAALAGRPVELTEPSGLLFEELDLAPAGLALQERCMLIPLHPGGSARRLRVPLELLAEATRARRRRRFLREREQVDALRRPWPARARDGYSFDSLLVQLLLTFREGLPLEGAGELPPRCELGLDPSRAALMLLFARDQGFYGADGLDLVRCMEYFDLPPYERLGRRARYATGLRCWNELALRPWAAGPCPVPALRARVVDCLLQFAPGAVLEGDLEGALGDDLPPERLYRRAAAAVARYLELWGLVETTETPQGLAIRLAPEYTTQLTLLPPYPPPEGSVEGWLAIEADGRFTARLDAPFDDLHRLAASDPASLAGEERGLLRGKLDRQGLSRALSAGHSAAALADTLRRGAGSKLPRRIELLLQETASREGEVELLPAGGVLRFRDALDLALARQGPAGPLLGEEIAPGLVLLPDRTDLGRVRKLLEQKGLHVSVCG